MAALSRVFVCASCAAAATLAALPVSAQEAGDASSRFARRGVFLGLGALYALENFDTDAAIEDPDNELDITADDAGGLELRGGYRVHPNVALEMLYQFYGGFAVKERTTDVDDHFDGWSLTAGGKLYPFLGRVQPYALAGLGGLVFTEKQGDDSGFLARLGGGVDVYATDHVVFAFEIGYALPAGSIDDFQFVTFSAGIQYRF
jgi:opacity protein-like surface antigen